MVADNNEHCRVVLGVDGLHCDVDQPGHQVGQQEEEQRVIVNSLDKVWTPVHGACLQSLRGFFGGLGS